MRNKKNGKKFFSLAVKLNILITVIVLTVSLVLISISYDSYKRTAYFPAHSNMADAAKRLNTLAPMWISSAVKVYYLTGKEELENVRDVESWDLWDTMSEWLSGYRVGELPEDVFTTEEYEALCARLEAEAIEAGMGEDEISGWMFEHDPRISALSVTALDEYVNLANYMNIGVEEGIDWVHVYVEEGSGYVELIECIDIASKLLNIENDVLNTWTFEAYGKHFDRVEEIERFKSLGSQEDFRMDTETANLLVNVIAGEKNGTNIYAVYACDVKDVVAGQRAFLQRNLLMMGLLMIVAVAVGLLIMRHMATKPLRELTQAATGFAQEGNSYSSDDVMDLDIRSNDEIGALYREIRSMQLRIIENTENITRMTAEKERLSTELDLARSIQANMLPSIFPAFPERPEFDIYASMDPAKEVGGDFYDFFLIDEDHLAMVIADVSGKGVPAALFMMISKIILQEKAKMGESPAKVLEQINEEIMLNNRNDMFVTVWLGVLELSTGILTASNAGHEYPLLKCSESGFEVFRDKHGFVVGSLPDRKYVDYKISLKPGSKLFVYTDGVPEACDADENLFGIDRLLTVINQCADDSPEEILRKVRVSIDEFAGKADQFDDLTMLCLQYYGKR